LILRVTIAVSFLLIVVGIAVLGVGADVLVRGAVAIAKSARVPAAVIGLTIVSMGTSLPELTVSVSAALKGASDLGVGNAVGSSIFNIGIVLGLTALARPIRVHSSAVRLEWPFMMLASCQLLLLARDGRIDRLEGAFFAIGLVLFTAYAVRVGRTEVGAGAVAGLADEVERTGAPDALPSVGKALLFVGAGVGLLVIGGDVLLRGAIDLARAAGMTERVIGLTIVAAGTGSPELATSLMAARRGESGIALGNVIGSNIFNILGILGVVALVRPVAVSMAMVTNDMVWMLGFAAFLFPMMRTNALISRAEGGLLVVAYAIYVALLAFAG
jgi:cation:H+ antiporter